MVETINNFKKIIETVKKDIKSTRLRVMENANKELLYLYFRLGKVIDENSKYGNNFINELSIELKLEFPDVKGLSPRNLSRMRTFYKEYKDIENLPVPLANLPWTHNYTLIEKVKDYLSSWDRSEMIKALKKEHANFVSPPLKKTNILLKNPNFRIAVRLWDIIRTYDLDKKDESKESDDNNSIDIMKSFLDHSFLIDYAVLDSMARLKRDEKKNMTKYAVIILTEEIDRVMTLLASCGYKTTEDELLSLIAKELKEEKKKKAQNINTDDVKKKFKSAMEEYLERTQKYL